MALPFLHFILLSSHFSPPVHLPLSLSLPRSLARSHHYSPTTISSSFKCKPTIVWPLQSELNQGYTCAASVRRQRDEKGQGDGRVRNEWNAERKGLIGDAASLTRWSVYPKIKGKSQVPWQRCPSPSPPPICLHK